jgi:nitrate/nitrite transporter NarK
VAQLIIGGVIMKYGYGPIFAVCSVMYLVALAAVHFSIGEIGVIGRIPAAFHSSARRRDSNGDSMTDLK